MDQLILKKSSKTFPIDLPKFGEVKLIVQNGKVVRIEKLESNKVI